jgi:ABC-2 type transport system ATP-binding protein
MPVDLQVRDLTKSYGNTQAVRSVSLDVSGGEIFGLLGPNGAGKTTTLECILGLRQPDGGTIHIAGIDAVAHPQRVKQLIGAQLQATALQDKITPREALKFFGAFYRDAIKPSLLLERFSLVEKADATFDSLSAGQKQRLALALAFVNNPGIIFLDEPTAGLDAQSRRELHEDIAKLKSDGRTVILSTHYIEEAHRLCDRIAIINRGQITATGSPAELIQRAQMPDKVIVKTSPMLGEEQLTALNGAGDVKSVDADWHIATGNMNQLVISLVKLIEQQNVQLIDLQIHRATLEDAFLKLIAPV